MDNNLQNNFQGFIKNCISYCINMTALYFFFRFIYFFKVYVIYNLYNFNTLNSLNNSLNNNLNSLNNNLNSLNNNLNSLNNFLTISNLKNGCCNLCYNCNIIFTNMEQGLMIYNGFDDDYCYDISYNVTDLTVSDIVTPVEVVKYEDKYLIQFNKMGSGYLFSPDELNTIKNKTFEFLAVISCNLTDETKMINSEIVEKGLEYIDVDSFEACENSDNNDTTYIKEKKEKILEEIELLRSDVNKIGDKLNNHNGLHKEAVEQANNFVIKERLDKLKNNFIIEKTPLGNVVMYYNNERESFEYYTDNSIPYRFLETIGRKYVITFDCKPIYVDMANELKDCEQKLQEKDLKLSKEKEELDKRAKELEKDLELKKDREVVKKNVFTKFKSYNKESGTGRVNTGAPPKNSIPNNTNNVKHSSGPILLKENSNRYTCMGRFANFNILKKIDRKNVDKKFAMSFSDFKKQFNLTKIKV
jgi:hypothetical protein